MQSLSKPQRLALSYLFLLKTCSETLQVETLDESIRENLELSVINACFFLKPSRKKVFETSMEVELSVEQISSAFELTPYEAEAVYLALNDLC